MSHDGGSRLDDDVPTSAPPPTGAKTRALLERFVRDAVARSGGTLTELRLFTLRGFLVAVRIRTEDASGFLKDRATSLVEGLRSVTKAGWYLETDDTDGPVLIIDRGTIEGSPDYGRGSLWVRPSLASCGPFVTLGTLGTPGRTPPCPA